MKRQYYERSRVKRFFRSLVTSQTHSTHALKGVEHYPYTTINNTTQMREKDSETNNQPASSSSLSSSSKRAPDRKDEDNKEEKLVKSKIKTESFLPAITTTTALLSLACVPIHILTAFASVVGVGTSVHVLRAAYKPAMNRCRCHLKSEKQWLAESASR